MNNNVYVTLFCENRKGLFNFLTIKVIDSPLFTRYSHPYSHLDYYLYGQEIMRTIPFYLVSDSTGETVSAVAHSSIVQFENIEMEEHVWPMIRTEAQLDKLLHCLELRPGIVFYTLVEPLFTQKLHEVCHRLKIPCLSILSRFVDAISCYTSEKIRALPGKQHDMSQEYFSRIEAINFTLAHDDGQALWNLHASDIILVGVSRTSKTPTSIYLSYRGYRVSNVPYVPPFSFPDLAPSIHPPLIVGLTIAPDRLIQVSNNRVESIDITGTYHDNMVNHSYIDVEAVRAEIKEAKRLFVQRNWPIIDVTRRSVEETAAMIIQYYHRHRQKFQKLQENE